MTGELEDIARIITAGLGQGVTTDDFKAACAGDRSVGRYMAEAIINAGYSKEPK